MFTDRLNKVAGRIDGYQALALVAKDGMPVESITVRPELDLEILAAELLTQVRAISQSQQELGVGAVRHFSILTDQLILMVTSISEEYFLILVLEAGSNLGKARFELRRSVLLFETDLP